MRKLIIYSLASLLFLSCSLQVPNNSTKINNDFSDLEMEYISFSTKALSYSYVKRMFGKYLGGTVNSTQLTRQLEFSRYLKNRGDGSYETSLKGLFTETPSLYTQMTAIAAIQTKITNESATFGAFVDSLAPIAGVTPEATTATNILDTSFTANWKKISYATEYTLFVSNGTTTTIYNISGVNTLSYNLTGLTSGTNYSYYIKAVNQDGQSLSSNIISAPTLTVGKLSATANVGTAVTDGNTGTIWNSGGYCCGQVVYMTLPAIKTITKFRLYPNASPSGWDYYDFYISTDAINYTKLGNFTDYSLSWTFHNITPALVKSVKIVPTNWSSSWVAIGEIEIYGY